MYEKILNLTSWLNDKLQFLGRHFDFFDRQLVAVELPKVEIELN
jgi:hypothetical protein